MRPKWQWFIAVSTGLLLLAGCNSSGQPLDRKSAAAPPPAATSSGAVVRPAGQNTGAESEQAAAAPAPAQATGSMGVRVGDRAPGFQLQDVLTEQTVAHQAGKPTILFFMASWCASCGAEETALAQVRAKYGDGVQIVSVDVDTANDTPDSLKQFARSFRANWPHAMDTNDMIRKFRLRALDTTYVIASDGTIAYTDMVPTSPRVYDQILSKLIGGS